MHSPNSVIKFYTQPSCTLEILDRGLPGSMPGNATSQLQFELRLNGSRLANETQINIQGDRHQLAELHEAVTTYVQNLLGSSSDRFNVLFGSQPNLSASAIDSSAPAAASYSYPHVSEDTGNPDENVTPTREIYLRSSSELSHNLFLGTLAAQETGRAIELTTLQLFDLASVLDEYTADVLTAPAIVRPRKAASTPSTAWASIAAMLLLGVGLTAVVVQLLNSSDENRQTAQKANIPKSNAKQQQIALNLPPSPQLSSPNPQSPYSLPSPNSATGKLSSPDVLPSLPPVGTSNVPTANPSSGIPATTTPLSSTQLPTLRSNFGVPSPPAIPTSKITPISSLPGIAQTPPIAKPLPQQKEKSPILAQSGVTAIPGINSAANIPRSSAQANPADMDISPVLSTANQSANSQITARQKIKAALEGQSNDSPELPSAAPNTPGKSNNSKIALVNTPQLAEVKDYFVKHWEPPSGLTQTLEYSIVLDVDGSIERIEPLGKAARTYVDRSGMPLIGEPFVSANSQGTTPRIRVVLSPDGKVQAFVEPD